MAIAPADKCRMPQAFWRAVEHLGLQPTAILRLARLPVTLHLQAQQLVTTAQLFAIWSAVEKLTNDPAIGIKLVEASDAAGHQPLFLAACYAATYRDGLARIARFKLLASPELFHQEERDGEVVVYREWVYANEPEPAASVDVSFGFLVALGRKGTGQQISPVRVDFSRPGFASELHSRYFDCPINFGAQRNMLVLKSEDLDRPFPGHNSEILEILTPALRAALGDFGPHSTVSDQVKVVLKRSLASGRPEIASVARDLGTSERTLQRRITDDGTTFRDLLVEARRELCRQLLPDETLEVDEVACLLGYQDASSFYRAFREWEGDTPSRWRERNLTFAQTRNGSGGGLH